MLKLFRKIRHQLIKESSFQKYLLYALGEIFLVVIGILIALQINNWNEQNKNKQAENKALMDLKQEMESNFGRLEFICNSKRKSESELRVYLAVLTNDSLSIHQKSKLRQPDIIGMTWNATHSVLTGLINSGGIDRIENDSLKNLLTNWPTLVHRWEKREDHMRDKEFQRLAEYLETRLIIDIPKEEEREDWIHFYPNNVEDKLNSQRAKLVNDLKYQNLMARIIGGLWIQSKFCADLQTDYYQILHQLNKEIEGRGIFIE